MFTVKISILKVFFLFFLLFLSAVANAKITQTISAKEYEKLEKVQAFIEEKKYQSAKKILDGMKQKKGLNNYTRAQISNFSAFYYYDQGKYNSALKEYLRVVEDPEGIPEGIYNQTFYTIAQLYFQLENYNDALKYAKRWFSVSKNPPADAHMLIGQAYFMLDNYRMALPEVKKGIRMYETEGKNPKENWLVLLRGIYYEKNDNKNMLPVIKKLLKLYPKPDYLFALAGVYSGLGDNAKMASVLEAMYDFGLLKGKGKQVVNLASLYMLQEAPYKAALILDKEIKSGEIAATPANYLLLAQAYMLSKEYELSLPSMKKAAAISNNPSHYFDLGQSYLFLSRLSKAEASFKKSLSLSLKKSSKEKEPVMVALGMTLFEQKKLREAKEVFASIIRKNPNAKVAIQWVSYIESEEIRIQKINEPIVVKAIIKS
jgi:tetratricopeptide (TPR) repeat protein